MSHSRCPLGGRKAPARSRFRVEGGVVLLPIPLPAHPSSILSPVGPTTAASGGPALTSGGVLSCRRCRDMRRRRSERRCSGKVAGTSAGGTRGLGGQEEGPNSRGELGTQPSSRSCSAKGALTHAAVRVLRCGEKRERGKENKSKLLRCWQSFGKRGADLSGLTPRDKPRSAPAAGAGNSESTEPLLISSLKRIPGRD